MFDAIVVGSGPAAVWTAYKLRPLKILMLDVGYSAPSAEFPDENLYDLRQREVSTRHLLLGKKFENLEHLSGGYVSPKLRGHLMRYVVRRPAEVMGDVLENFDLHSSYSRGGLANAWGAGVFRFVDGDLTGFPINEAELEAYYDELTAHIGISGTADDTAEIFGSDKQLLPPLPLSSFAQEFLGRYEGKASTIREKKFLIGRQRAAVLSKEHRGRRPYQGFAREFFQSQDPAIYTPNFTLEELIAQREVTYLSNRMVERFEETEKGVEVFAKNLETGELEAHSAKKLFLGAGAINSSRIVLKSYSDHETRLPLLDNAVRFIPFLSINRIGTALDRYSYVGAELVAIDCLPEHRETIQASIYALNGSLRTDLIAELPLSVRSNLILSRFLTPALGMLQVFAPDDPEPQNYLQLLQDGKLNLKYASKRLERIEQRFLSLLWTLRYVTLPHLVKSPLPGSSIHYAGGLPMQDNPQGRYQTNRFGKLNETRGIYVVDAANFPRLPSKNLTFTIMANAMRIAEHAKKH